MKAAAWLVLLSVATCGDGPTDPVVLEVPIVDSVLDIAGGDYATFTFSVDLAQMDTPAVTGAFAVAGGTAEQINFLVLSAGNLALWKNSDTYTAVLERGPTSGGEFQAMIANSGEYHFVLSNLANTGGTRVAFYASLVYEKPAE